MDAQTTIESRSDTIAVNGRNYRWPKQPSIVICFDGCGPSYLDAASAAGVIPALDSIRRSGFFADALAAMPTFTNPNNISIVCGAPPAVHGVSGNYYYDRELRREIMMVDATAMRAETILARFSQAGARVVAVTAKDKLRKALGLGLKGIAFSAEKADACSLEENGIADVPGIVGRPAPDQYSADLSLFVLDAGIRILQRQRPDILYLSLSDYVQHKHAPGTPEANAFMQAVDARIKTLLDLGAVVGIVADHGMTDMCMADGRPNVIFVGDQLDDHLGPGATRVICPITDPFVRHHGALGGFVRVHFEQDDVDIQSVIRFLGRLPGVALALSRADACRRFDLPMGTEGDIAVIGRSGFALGGRAVDHDLSALAGERLRSHGGLSEQVVPFMVSKPLVDRFHGGALRLRNFDIFDAVLNGVEA